LNQSPLPGETYTITWSTNPPSDVTLSPASRSFTASDFAAFKAFTITAINDAVVDGTTLTRVNFSATSNFGNSCASDTHVIVQAIDND